jgi:hypothetical protein
MPVQASATIHWSTSALRTGTIRTAASGSTIGDTLNNIKEAILTRMDSAPDEQVFNWTNVQIQLVRDNANGQ